MGTKIDSNNKLTMYNNKNKKQNKIRKKIYGIKMKTCVSPYIFQVYLVFYFLPIRNCPIEIYFQTKDEREPLLYYIKITCPLLFLFLLKPHFRSEKNKRVLLLITQHGRKVFGTK